MANTKIKPQGWLLDFLKTQKTGLTGHMEKAGYPYDHDYWGTAEHPKYKGIFWWPFEQTAYHIDGMTRTGILLEDAELLEKAKKIIYAVIENPDEEGYLGPIEIKAYEDDTTRWSHVVFFRACLALYEYNHDARIIDAMTRHYLGHAFDYSEIRNVYHVEIMLELYRHNGNAALLQMAVENYEKGFDNSVAKTFAKITTPAHVHGVTYNEYAKLGALLYRATGEKRYLEQSVKAYKKIFKLYMLPGGCNSSSEYMRNNRYDEVYEMCDVSDMTWSLHYLAEITDNISYSDAIETCIFNAGIGSVTEDFRALQYFSGANQLIFNETSSHCKFDLGGKSMTYAPMPFTACCPGNMNRFMPNYILSMWSQKDDTVTARMYGPSVFSGKIGEKSFSVEEKTTYPFDLSAEFSIQTEVPFMLRLRVPTWCKTFTLSGAEYKVENGYAVISVQNDVVLTLIMEADILQKENHGGVYFTRGPLVYTLGMKGERSFVGDAEFPDYRMMPDKKWNYAIIGDGAPVYESGCDTVWDVDKDLPSITVSAREITSWKFRRVKKLNCVNWKFEPFVKTGDFTLTPSLPRRDRRVFAENETRIKLCPYGAAKVRMTVLPQEDQ